MTLYGPHHFRYSGQPPRAAISASIASISRIVSRNIKQNTDETAELLKVLAG